MMFLSVLASIISILSPSASCDCNERRRRPGPTSPIVPDSPAACCEAATILGLGPIANRILVGANMLKEAISGKGGGGGLGGAPRLTRSVNKSWKRAQPAP